jgi:hypothetical protein
MIPKIHKSNKLYGTLLYNQQKVDDGVASVLGVNEIWESADGKYQLRDFMPAFNARLAVNNRTKSPIVHISLNPSPKDELTDGQLLSIGREYMQRMGFGEQPYVIFKHEDIERRHIHIVTTNIKPDGSKIDDRNNYDRSEEIANDIVRKYNLHPTEKSEEIWKPDKVSLEKGRVRYQIKNITKHLLDRYRFSTVNELKAALQIYNVDMQEVRNADSEQHVYTGVIYSATDDAGKRIATPIKASSLGKEYTLPAIEKKIQGKAKALESMSKNGTKQILRNSIAQSASKAELLQRLRESNVDIFFRASEAGRTYGVTVIDHNAKIIINGSKLGKEFSANVFQSLFKQWANGASTSGEVKAIPAQKQDASRSSNEEATESNLIVQQREKDFSAGGSLSTFSAGGNEESFLATDSDAPGSDAPEIDGGSAAESAAFTLDDFAGLLAGLFDVSVEPHREKKFVSDNDDENDKRKKRKKKKQRL